MMGKIIENLMRDIGKVGSERYKKPAAIVIKKEVVEGPKEVEGDEIEKLLAALREAKEGKEPIEAEDSEDSSDKEESMFSEKKEDDDWMSKPESLDEVLKERKKRLGRA